MFYTEVRDAYRSLTWMISHPWRGLLRIRQATFKNNSLDSWRADLGLHLGRAAREGWRLVHRGQILQLHSYLHRGCELQSWKWFREAIRFPSPIPESIRVCEWQATGRWRGKQGEREAVVLHQMGVAYPPNSSPFSTCIVSWPINIHKSLSILFALFYHACRPDPYLP